MSCHEARELFSARADAELAPDEAARLEEHLAGCDECRLEWARFARVVSLVQATPAAHAPAGFVDRVVRAADPTPWPLRVLRGVFLPLRIKVPLEAAALLLIGGLAVMIFQRSPEMQQVARQDYAAQPPAVAAPEAKAPAEPSARSRIARAEPTPAAPTTTRAPAPAQSDAARPATPPPVAATPPPVAAPPPRVAAPPPPQPDATQERRDALGATARRESAVKSTGAAPAPGEPSSAPPAAPSRSAPTPAPTATATAPPPAPLAAPARTGPDVSAWVTVADRPAAMTALADALRRHGGRETARRADGRAELVELAVPRDAYDAFIRDVSRLGGFAIQRQTPELPASVSMSLRITD